MAPVNLLRTGTLGVLGKVPARPDFVRIQAGGASFEAFDQWLVGNMEWAAARARPEFPAAFAHGAIQAFVFRPPERSVPLLVGALGPSADRAGRQFPIAAAAPLVLEATLTAQPQLLPLMLEEVWQRASRAVASRWLPDEKEQSELSTAPAPELTPTAEDALEAYGEWIAALTLAELWSLTFDGNTSQASHAVALIAEAVRPYRGIERSNTPLSLRLPLGKAGGAALCFWIDLLRRLGRWQAVVPSFFWSHDGHTGALMLHLGDAPPSTLSELWLPTGARDEICDLTTTSSAAHDASVLTPPAELAAVLASSSNTISSLLRVAQSCRFD